MFDNTVTVIELILIAILYMLPTLIAFARDIPQRLKVTVFNIILGWTLIGWIVAFLWARMAQTTADETA